MFTVNTFSKLPVWEQITEEIKKYILLGFLKPGDKIPSVREFSLKAGINPNTVAKSYGELTRLGIISAAGGIGTFVTPDAVEKIKEIAKILKQKQNTINSKLTRARKKLKEIMEVEYE